MPIKKRQAINPAVVLVRPCPRVVRPKHHVSNQQISGLTASELTPAEHEHGQNLRAKLLDEQVGGHAKDDVGDREDGDGDIVVIALHVQRLGHARDLGVADVGAVEEGDQEQHPEDGHDAQVQLPEQLLLQGWVNWGPRAVEFGGGGVHAGGFQHQGLNAGGFVDGGSHDCRKKESIKRQSLNDRS
ncbi:hypothetical protein T310_4365 [Rasamsonia emersonii CBS 393.64]|uniref:Uncharacterized protein n=1 Tax=Rasamsonia emersonii (strain ATCC 16479 / CBS 393.64 / IMI 116815) TaxID=1408163 RepID=A0A0F4YVB0_RASE3|nr:hypothetical protein T310_4365 [Rasamsonia emersonii CBS 393.64]KKA21578.1 hypothetical protein T310_4365 [Rasamsonia emersonii CBS 393.64]